MADAGRFEDEHLAFDAGPEVPELTRCVECGRSMHALTAWRFPRCLACRLPTYRRTRPATRAWSPWELSLLRRPDLSTREIQRRTGRSPIAIRVRRWKTVGPAFTVRKWTPEEDAAVLRRDRRDTALAREIGRTVGAIRTRRLTCKRGRAADLRADVSTRYGTECPSCGATRPEARCPTDSTPFLDAIRPSV